MKTKYIIGAKFKTAGGYTFEVINRDKNNITIKFENGVIKTISKKHIYRVLKQNRLPITDAKFRDVSSKCYKTWKHMLDRALFHYKYGHEIRTNYDDTSVCDEWRNYNIFKKWFEENYYELENERVELDKDILIKGNKIYSPSTCIFVPQKINSLLINKSKTTIDKRRKEKNTDELGNKLPIGITWRKDKRKYRASLNIGHGKVVNLGSFNTIEEAFDVYKTEKEKRIKQVANEYKEYIPEKLYDALYNYKIEIDD